MSVQAATKAPRVRLSLDVSPELHTALKIAAARRRITMSELLRQLLTGAVAALGDGPMSEDLDDLAVRRELAAASVAALGGFWDNEVDAQWQDFQP